jgi:lysozyme
MLPSFPGQETSLVVDLSHYFPNADLAAAAQNGVVGAILKASQGDTWHDPDFATLLGRARAADLPVGAYHFGTAADTAAQLENFIAAVANAAGRFGSIVAVLDVETNCPTPEDTINPDEAEKFVAGFRARTGQTPIVYAGSYLRERGGAVGRPNLAACPLWVAQYGYCARTLPGWRDWTLWQFTDGHSGPHAGKVPGIGLCDQSIFRGSQADLAALWTSLNPALAMAWPEQRLWH